jgi:hypothetical protein
MHSLIWSAEALPFSTIAKETSKMKTFKSALLFASTLILVLASAGLAQEQQAQNTDTLRDKVSDIERIDIAAKPASQQMIYKRARLNVYLQFQSSLERDIADLTNTQSAIGNDAELQRDVAGKLQELKRERKSISDKIQTLKSSLQTTASAGATATTARTAETAASETPIANASFTRPRISEPASSPLNAEGARVATTDMIPPTDSIAAASAKPQETGDGVKKEETTKTVKVCGQIRPASLTQTFALIESTSTGLDRTKVLAATDAVRKSRYDDNCAERNNDDKLIENLRRGEVRNAAFTEAGHEIRTDPSAARLKEALADIDDKGQPKKDRSADRRVELFNGSQKEAVVLTLQTLLKDLEKGEVRSDIGPEFKNLSRETIKKQILILNEYIGNVRVIIKEGDKIVATPMTDKDGNYEVTLVPDKNYTFSTEADDSQFVREVVLHEPPPDGAQAYRVNIFIEDRPVSLLARAVVGYEQAGAASTKRDQNYFFNLYLSKTFPIGQKINPDFGERLRTWLDFRFASVPQAGDVALGEFSTGFVTQVSGLKVKDVANVFEFLGGLEYRLFGNRALLPSFDRRTKQKFSLSLIAGAGIITPTNPRDSITTFKVFDDAPGLPPSAVGKEFVAFVQSDRDRFFRQYYLGLRLQTFFFNRFNMPMQRFPAQMDIAVGQNEFVTGGKLRGAVVRIEGYFPLPYKEMEYINIFGTAMLRPGRARTALPLVLELAPDGTVIPASNVALIEVPQQSRDYYRVGMGLDFISFIKKMKETMSNK